MSNVANKPTEQSLVYDWDVLPKTVSISIKSILSDSWDLAINSIISDNILSIYPSYKSKKNKNLMIVLTAQPECYGNKNGNKPRFYPYPQYTKSVGLSFIESQLSSSTDHVLVACALGVNTKGKGFQQFSDNHCLTVSTGDKCINVIGHQSIQDYPFVFVKTLEINNLEEIYCNAIKKKNQEQKQSDKTLESQIEQSIYNFLVLNGIDVHRQVKTSEGHFLDLWIPDSLIIELKRDLVSGNDVCQCIDYVSKYNLPVILAGKRISEFASRGIDGFNSLWHNQKIHYVDLSNVLSYLYQYLGI